jgi:L-iditol 2-dehydrogenase
VEQLNLKPRSKVLVVGAGPMGALFALLFKAKNIPVAVVEPAVPRRQRIASWDIETREPGQIKKGAYDTVIVAVNKKELVGEYITLAADGGTVLMFSGLGRTEEVSVEAHSIHYRQVSLKGSFGYAMRHFKEALSLIDAHKEMFSKIITHRYPLERGREAFDLLASGEALKIVLEP